MDDPLSQPRQRRSLAVVALLRPKQWIKNLFILGPLLFSRSLGNVAMDMRVLAAFGAFCLMSGAVYVLNDLMDAEADRFHPEKRLRPIASGEISRGFAIVLAAGLALLSLGVSLTEGWMLSGLLLCYAVINVTYSLGLKRVVIADVMMIGAGFVIRVLAGAAAISVSPSHWLVLCTILIAVFLGFTKRRAEIVLLENGAPQHRQVLGHYSAAFLDQMISVVTSSTLMCYILYAVDKHTIDTVSCGSRGLLLTVPFVMYGIFRYLYLVYHRQEGGSPTTALLNDKLLIVDVVLWATVSLIVLYYPGFFRDWFST